MEKEKLVNPSIQKGKPNAFIYCGTENYSSSGMFPQEEAGVNHCLQNGIEVYKVFKDDGEESNWINGKGLNEIISILEKQGKGGIPVINYLICFDSTVIANFDSIKVQNKLKKIESLGVEIIYLHQPKHRRSRWMGDFALMYISRDSDYMEWTLKEMCSGFCDMHDVTVLSTVDDRLDLSGDTPYKNFDKIMQIMKESRWRNNIKYLVYGDACQNLNNSSFPHNLPYLEELKKCGINIIYINMLQGDMKNAEQDS